MHHGGISSEELMMMMMTLMMKADADDKGLFTNEKNVIDG